MADPASRSGDATPRALPKSGWHIRVRRRLRAVKAWWWRRNQGRRLPAWAGPTVDAPAGAGQWRWQGDLISISVESTGLLRQQLLGVEPGATVRRLELEVHDWRPPWPGWSGRVGPLPGLVRQEVRLPEDAGPATVRVDLVAPAPLGSVLAATLPALEPWRPLPAPTTPRLAGGGDPPGWLRAEDFWPRAHDVDEPYKILRPHDLRLAGPGACGEPRDPTRLDLSRYGVSAPGEAELIVVDATSANPNRRQHFAPALPTGLLRFAGAADAPWWEIAGEADGDVVVTGRCGEPLTDRQRSALLRLGLVTVAEDPPDTPPAAVAAAVAQLAMVGVTLHAPDLGADASARLAPELVALVRAPLPAAGDDPIEWELRNVAQRRAAMRGHASGFTWPRAASAAYPSLGALPSVTALLVTRRPQHVVTAVAALAAQTYPELEIVVGLHGRDLPRHDRERLADLPALVHVLPIRAELSLGEALAETTRLARGSLVTKVDDDDGYGSEHVWDLVLARHYAGATVVGKAAEFVYLEPCDATVRRFMGSELYNSVVAGGTIMIGRGDLEAIGGWRPLPRAVDRGLLDRVMLDGGLIYRTHGFGFLYTRHGAGHTWDQGLDYFLRDPRQIWQGVPPYSEFAPRHGRAARVPGQRGEP